MKDLVFFFRTSAYLKERWRIQWNLLNCDMSILGANYITFYFLSFLGWEFSIQFFVEVGDVYHKTDSHFLVKHLLGNHSYWSDLRPFWARDKKLDRTCEQRQGESMHSYHWSSKDIKSVFLLGKRNVSGTGRLEMICIYLTQKVHLILEDLPVVKYLVYYKGFRLRGNDEMLNHRGHSLHEKIDLL